MPSIFPIPDPQAKHNRMQFTIVAYARKIESDVYNMADSRFEYYHLLAEKIYKIQKKLDEKSWMQMAAAVSKIF